MAGGNEIGVRTSQGTTGSTDLISQPQVAAPARPKALQEDFDLLQRAGLVRNKTLKAVTAPAPRAPAPLAPPAAVLPAAPPASVPPAPPPAASPAGLQGLPAPALATPPPSPPAADAVAAARRQLFAPVPFTALQPGQPQPAPPSGASRAAPLVSPPPPPQQAHPPLPPTPAPPPAPAPLPATLAPPQATAPPPPTPAPPQALAGPTPAPVPAEAPLAPPPADSPPPPPDPVPVTNPQAPRSIGDEDFAGLVGNVRIAPLLDDANIRRLASETAMADMARFGTGAAGRINASTRQKLGFDATTMRAFTRQGLAALSDEQKAKLSEVLADERINQLRALGGRSGVITQSRVGDLFDWVDKFDSDGDSEQLTLATPGTGAATLTASGVVLQRLLENNSRTQTVTATEEDFIKGFRNGYFDPAKFEDKPENQERREALRKAGLLERFDEAARANPGQHIQLNVPQLVALYRVADHVDKDGHPDTIVTRTTSVRNGTLPFNVSNSADQQTAAGEVVASLNSIFTSNYKVDSPAEEALSPYDVPPASATDVNNPMDENRQRLSDRATVDRDAFNEYMRDARIDLGGIYAPQSDGTFTMQQLADQSALASAGFTQEKLYAIAAPNGTIGGPNGEMARLYAALQEKQGTRGPLVLNTNTGSITAPAAGRAISVLERYTTRYDLVTSEQLKASVSDGMHFRSEFLDQKLARERLRPIPLVPLSVPNPLDAPPTVRQELQRLGFNVDDFEAAMVRSQGADRSKWDPKVASAELYTRLKGLGVYMDPRPGTIAFAALSEATGARQPTAAGQIWDLMRNSGYLAVTEQQRRSYFDASAARMAPAGMPQTHLRFTHYVMNSPTDCLETVSRMSASNGGRPVMRDGRGSWLATSDDMQGRISASSGDLTAAKAWIDYWVDQKHIKVPIGVARLNGRNLNIDHMTDHYLLITGHYMDATGREVYDYADSARKYVGQFYVDPNTNLLYVPVNAPWTVGHGGYQLSHIRAFADGNFRQEYFQITGRYPRDATPYYERREAQREARRSSRRR